MIRVLLVEPMNLLRGALVAALSLEDDLTVAADLATLAEVPGMARAVHPDVAVISAGLLEDTALDQLLPGCGILLLAGDGSPGRLGQALKGRVRGFVHTQAAPCELVAGIRQAARGEKVLDARLAVAVLAAPRNPLSPRELAVLNAAASGAPHCEVASRLHLTVGTVRNYVSAILRKTGARNRLEAVRIAESAGWLDQVAVQR